MRRSISVSAIVVIALLGSGCAGDAATERSATSTETSETTTPVAPYVSEVYADPAHWLCRPDTSDDVCDADLDTTVVAADGTTTVEPFHVAEDPAVDCFYVYPTFSDDPTPNSDLVPNDSEGWPTLNQAARFAQVCRLFAPVYRQITMAALFGGSAPTEESREIAYADVLDAWRHYLANDNEGRGVVLIGHSQGASMLRRLLTDEIDPDEGLRSQLVSALLLGSAVRIPDATATVGGDFRNIPACTSRADVGCVVSYATFSAAAPPPQGARFGKPGKGDGVAMCTNPAALGGGSGKLTSYFTTETVRGRIETTDTITTPFVKFESWADGACRDRDGIRWLEATFPAGADARPDGFANAPNATWGLHLVDVNLAMGNLLELVSAQADAFAD